MPLHPDKVERGEDGVDRCTACGQPVDDIQTMTEAELLQEIHVGSLRELARTLRSGNATHQELAVAARILKDNNKRVDPEDDDDEEDPNLPPKAEKRAFPNYEHNE
jgi:hypothetical protein